MPLSLAGTCAAMWAAGFSINNLTLMALAVSVGFVVDDAIVMIENMFRNLERGHAPMQAALDGARQIGFTVVSISVSLVAAFIPLLFMDGVVGRLLREFSVTLVFAIAVSTVVSLTVTPMICAHFVRAGAEPPTPRGSTALVEAVMGWMMRGYMRTLDVALRHRVLMMLVMLAHRRRDGEPLRQDAEGLFPAGRHRPDLRLHAGVADISFEAMLQAAAAGARHRAGRSRPSPASARRSARPASMPRSTRGACSSA